MAAIVPLRHRSTELQSLVDSSAFLNQWSEQEKLQPNGYSALVLGVLNSPYLYQWKSSTHSRLIYFSLFRYVAVNIRVSGTGGVVDVWTPTILGSSIAAKFSGMVFFHRVSLVRSVSITLYFELQFPFCMYKDVLASNWKFERRCRNKNTKYRQVRNGSP